jgi:hypothetical protein
LKVLDKIGKKTPEKSSINLAKKASAPIGGFTDQVQAPELKKQKTEASNFGGWKDKSSDDDNGMCINCGS